MARTIAPLLSFSASGQIAKTQVYASWKGRPYVRRYAIPGNPKTAEQSLTRDTFSFLNKLWRYFPSTATSAWEAYGVTSRFTARNGFLKQNISALREDSNLNDLVISPAANGGLAALAMTATPGDDAITVALTAPPLPTGWTIVQGIAMAVQDQDPQSGTLFVVTAGTDVSTPYSIVLSGLASAVLYQVGGWFQYLKPDGKFAYGIALRTTALTT